MDGITCLLAAIYLAWVSVGWKQKEHHETKVTDLIQEEEKGIASVFAQPTQRSCCDL